MKKILLITSVYTGAGHKSISDALAEQFDEMPDVEVKVIDGFDFAGGLCQQASKLYGFSTRHAPIVHNASWEFTTKHPAGFAIWARVCDRHFVKCLRDFQPDLILTVHALFTRLLIRMLKMHDLDIPVVVLQADIVSMHRYWCVPEAYRTICPTKEAYESSLRQGVPAERLKLLGFPVRKQFCDAARAAEEKDFDGSRPLRCLLMSGGEGSGSLGSYAEAILENTDASVTIICGRNKKLRAQLQKNMCGRYGDRVKVFGFVPVIEKAMLQSDLLITRGSPNTLFEAITMNLPLIMTGPALSQEKGNAEMMRDLGLGVICGSAKEVPEIIRNLTDDNGARLREMQEAQRAYRSFDSAKEIAVYVAGLAEQSGAPYSF